MDGIIYLATPYSHPDPITRQARYVTACRIAGLWIERGFVIFSPIAHSHGIATARKMAVDFTAWQAQDEAILTVCAELWVVKMRGWKRSRGIKAELQFAKRRCIRVRFLAPNGEQFDGGGV